MNTTEMGAPYCKEGNETMLTTGNKSLGSSSLASSLSNHYRQHLTRTQEAKQRDFLFRLSIQNIMETSEN